MSTPACTFCGSDETELVSAWGGQIITSQVRCGRCNTYFEAIRDEFDAPAEKTARSADDAQQPHG